MNSRRVGVALVLAAAVAALSSAAADEGSDRTAAAPAAGGADAAAVEQGKMLYALHCSHCHGFNMVNPGTISFDLRRFPPDDKARFVNSVTNGKNNRMPPWGDVLSATEIDQLWAYIRSGGKS